MTIKYQFKLYIIGNTQKSEQIIANLRKVCRVKLGIEYELTVIDVLDNPQQAQEDKILVLPTLIKEFPLPVKRLTGNLLEANFLEALDL